MRRLAAFRRGCKHNDQEVCNDMRVRTLIAAAAVAMSVAAMGATSAFAGEIRGPGSPTGVPADSNPTPTAAPANANSICAFSGLNHLHLDANGNPEMGELLTRTQSYGQLVAAGLKDFVPSAGEACNGSTSGLKH
jgi:hypothetical protein